MIVILWSSSYQVNRPSHAESRPSYAHCSTSDASNTILPKPVCFSAAPKCTHPWPLRSSTSYTTNYFVILSMFQEHWLIDSNPRRHLWNPRHLIALWQLIASWHPNDSPDSLHTKCSSECDWFDGSEVGLVVKYLESIFKHHGFFKYRTVVFSSTRVFSRYMVFSSYMVLSSKSASTLIIY